MKKINSENRDRELESWAGSGAAVLDQSDPIPGIMDIEYLYG